MKLLSLVALGLLLCVIESNADAKVASFQTDLDHKVQYKVIKLSDKEYSLEVARLGGVNFSRMNLFTTRFAKLKCGNTGYSITYLSGVEGFDDRRAKPNYIFPSLKVKFTCP